MLWSDSLHRWFPTGIAPAGAAGRYVAQPREYFANSRNIREYSRIFANIRGGDTHGIEWGAVCNVPPPPMTHSITGKVNGGRWCAVASSTAMPVSCCNVACVFEMIHGMCLQPRQACEHSLEESQALRILSNPSILSGIAWTNSGNIVGVTSSHCHPQKFACEIRALNGNSS